MSSVSQPLLLDLPPSHAPAPARVPAPTAAAPTRHAIPVPAPRALSGLGLRAWLITECFLPAFRALVATISVWRWADKNVTLHGAGTGRGGPYNSARTPWVRQFTETFTDPAWREDHVIKCSRSGFTEAALCIIRFMPDHAPGPVHLALDSAKAATDVNRERLIPTLRRHFAREDTDDNDITARVVRLRNMVIRVTGSYTEGAFRQHGNRLVILDEVEVVNEIDGVGTLHDLGRSRIRGVDGARLLSMSKPVRWGSAHHCEVVTGTLSVNLVPCPHCGTYQELTVDGRSLIDQLRIDKPLRPGQPPLSPRLTYSGAPLGRLDFSTAKLLDGSWDLPAIERDTVYLCVSGCRIQQDAPLPPESLPFMSDEVREAHASGRAFTCKQAMTLSARWLPTNPRPIPRKRSRHISDLHSLDADMTWGIFARIWIGAQSDPSRVKTALNEHFGLPAREKAAEIGEEHILELRAPYRRGTIPFRPDIIVTSADTQDAYWKHVTVAARLDSTGQHYAEIAVVSWGIATSKPELIALLSTPLGYFPPEGDCETYHSLGGLVDAGGHRKDEVYELHYESAGRYFASYGRGGAALVTPTWSRQIEWRLQTLTIYMYHDDAWKRRLYLGSIARAREIKRCLADGYDPEARQLQPLIRTPGVERDKLLAQFETELQGERLNEEGEWERVPGTHNDFGDALKTARISLELQLPRVRAQWLARRTEAEKAKAKPTTP